MKTQALVGPGATDSTRTLRTGHRLVMAAIWAGISLTVVATIVPYIDRATSNTLTNHIRAGYPNYSQERIDTAATSYLVYLTVVGVLGVVGWLWVAHAIQAGKRWTPATATAAFLIGTSLALTDLLIKDTSGDTGLPSLIAAAGILPCLPGLVVVTLLWTGKQK